MSETGPEEVFCALITINGAMMEFAAPPPNCDMPPTPVPDWLAEIVSIFWADMVASDPNIMAPLPLASGTVLKLTLLPKEELFRVTLPVLTMVASFWAENERVTALVLRVRAPPEITVRSAAASGVTPVPVISLLESRKTVPLG